MPDISMVVALQRGGGHGVTTQGALEHESNIQSVYRRTKVGCIRCKISFKKGVHSVWAQKKKKKKERDLF